MKKFYNQKYIYFLLLLTGLASCKLANKKSWDADLLFPIAYGEVNINSLVNDSAINRNPDNSLQVIYGIPLADLNVGDFIQVPDTTLSKNVTLKQLVLGERSVQRNITLGEIAKNAGLAGFYIISNHGNTAVIPPFSNLSSGEVEINAQEFFKTATFISGQLVIEIENYFPIELTNVHYRIKNKNDGAIIAEDTIASILPMGRYTKTFSLNGKTVEGDLLAGILSMSSPGSNGMAVPIDTSDALVIKMTAKDLKLYSATAIFPAQNVVEDSVDILYNLGGAEIKEMVIRTGHISIIAAHTLQDSLHLNYIIPEAKLNNQPLNVFRSLAPAKLGDTAYSSETYPVDGYRVDLTGRNKDTFNTFFNILTARIDSTGKLSTFSLSDSIYLFYGLLEVVPQYLRGYLGQTTFNIGPESFTTDVLAKVQAGQITLEEVKVNLEIMNGVGAPATAIIKSLKASNSRSGKSVELVSNILNTPLNILRATDNPVLTPSITTITLDNANSNIKELLEVVPDKFEYSLEVQVNPNGNNKTYTDFLYYESSLSARLNVEMPLHLGVQGLALQDTLQINLDKIDELDDVRKATLYFQVENGFPFEAEIQAYLTDFAGNIIDSVWVETTNRILAGNLDQNLRVTAPEKSVVIAELSEEKWKKLVRSNNVIIKAKLNTIPIGQNVKIYDNYFLKMKVSTKVLYNNAF